MTAGSMNLVCRVAISAALARFDYEVQAPVSAGNHVSDIFASRHTADSDFADSIGTFTLEILILLTINSDEL